MNESDHNVSCATLRLQTVQTQNSMTPLPQKLKKRCHTSSFLYFWEFCAYCYKVFHWFVNFQTTKQEAILLTSFVCSTWTFLGNRMNGRLKGFSYSRSSDYVLSVFLLSLCRKAGVLLSFKHKECEIPTHKRWQSLFKRIGKICLWTSSCGCLKYTFASSFNFSFLPLWFYST